MPQPKSAPHGDAFARFQLTIGARRGPPQLREAAGALAGEEANKDPKAYLLQLGFALPDDATVDIDPTESDSPHAWHICIAGDAGHYHCAHFTLPDISFS